VSRSDSSSCDWIVRTLQNNIEQEIKRQQSHNLIRSDLIKIHLLSQVNPFITKSQELILILLDSVLKQDYPS
jgi:hypothetical protein